MYSNTTLYYLQQMGIRPWIKKQSTTAKQEALKLLVFVPSTLSTKAKSLVQQMMFYINLREQEVAIILVNKTDLLGSLIGQKNPLAILILGLNNHQLSSNVNCPVLTSIDPDDLITQPSDKRKVLQDLHYIKQLVS